MPFVPPASAASLASAVYDVKNARLCNIFEGEGLMHSEPVVDEKDVLRFLTSAPPRIH